MAELRTTGEILEKWNELHKDNPEAPETCFYGYVSYKDVAHLLAENQRLREAMTQVPHEGWCDTLNKISNRCNCCISPLFEALAGDAE